MTSLAWPPASRWQGDVPPVEQGKAAYSKIKWGAAAAGGQEERPQSQGASSEAGEASPRLGRRPTMWPREDHSPDRPRVEANAKPQWRGRYRYGTGSIPGETPEAHRGRDWGRAPGGQDEGAAGPPGAWGRAEAAPPAPPGASPVEQAILLLAQAQNRPPPPRPMAPEWPKFNDAYRTYAKFARELMAYLEDYCRALSERSVVTLIKKNCFIPRILAMIPMNIFISNFFL